MKRRIACLLSAALMICAVLPVGAMALGQNEEAPSSEINGTGEPTMPNPEVPPEVFETDAEVPEEKEQEEAMVPLEEVSVIQEQPTETEDEPWGEGSILSEGNFWIVLAVAVLAVCGAAALVITKKKKPAPVSGGNREEND